MSEPPSICKSSDLGSRLLAVLLEKDDAVGIRVERRVQVDEVHGLVLDVPPERVEVVAAVEDVRLGECAAMSHGQLL